MEIIPGYKWSESGRQLQRNPKRMERFKDNFARIFRLMNDIQDGISNSVLELHSVKVSLTKWNRTYKAATNTTTFSYNAGTTGNYSWSLSGGNVNVSLPVSPP